MNYFKTFLVCGFILAGGVVSAEEMKNAHSKFEPPDGQVLLFIGQNQKSIATYLKKFKDVPAGFMIYTSLQEVDGLDNPAKDRGAGVQFAKPFVNRYPATALQMGLYMTGALDGILGGQYDGNIQRLGEWIRSTRRPVFVRIGYEFDLPDNGYDPAQYRRAFRYIVDMFRKGGVSNVAFVWHSYGFFVPNNPIMSWYPGDDYVDWFGLSFFDPYNEANMKFFAKLAREHGKPLMLAEAAPTKVSTMEGERTWDIWFRRMFDFVVAENIKAISYIDCDWARYPMFQSLQWGDARLEASPFITRQWQEEINKSRYLKSSPELFSILSFSQGSCDSR